MNELALFAGAGGGILGGLLLGWRTVCAVELDAYAASVLVARQNDGHLAPFPVWDDVRTFDGRPWRGVVDVVSAGFPCQPFSSAARGRFSAENLWSEVIRIANEVQPRYVFVENVENSRLPGLRLSAADMGAPHIRRRLWSIGDANSDGKSMGAINAEASRLPSPDESVWGADPGSIRMADGLAYRMDRIRAIGNGQVPAVATCAWKTLVREEDAHPRQGEESEEQMSIVSKPATKQYRDNFDQMDWSTLQKKEETYSDKAPKKDAAEHKEARKGMAGSRRKV